MAESDDNAITHSLSKIPLFFGLKPDELKIILGLCKSDAFQADDIIFSEGDPSHHLYILLSGDVLIKTQRNGIIARLQPCDIFGEIGLITQRPRSASVIANSDCKLFRIDHVEFNFLSGKQPRISTILLRNISTNLANHVVRMNNAPLEHIPLSGGTRSTQHAHSQVLLDESN